MNGRLQWYERRTDVLENYKGQASVSSISFSCSQSPKLVLFFTIGSSISTVSNQISFMIITNGFMIDAYNDIDIVQIIRGTGSQNSFSVYTSTSVSRYITYSNGTCTIDVSRSSSYFNLSYITSYNLIVGY